VDYGARVVRGTVKATNHRVPLPCLCATIPWTIINLPTGLWHSRHQKIKGICPFPFPLPFLLLTQRQVEDLDESLTATVLARRKQQVHVLMLTHMFASELCSSQRFLQESHVCTQTRFTQRLLA